MAMDEVLKLFAKVANDEAINYMIAYGNNERNIMLDEAALALCKIKDEKIIPHLEALSQSQSAKVKDAAQKQLAKLSKSKQSGSK